MKCPCCSGKSYGECCKPYHLKEKFASTAEALMRSRFCAFAIPNGEYLMDTTLPEKRKYHNKEDLHEWGESNEWIKLEILEKPSMSKVEFNAYFVDEEGNEQIHHELSTFKMIQNRWYYASGKFLD
ncbi:YchJ family protein [Chryseobacterium sp.]|uniref:YchJ family protein n=1 Tax=Chryseobacterium sp. TaxID=1871047 RepID=UPI00289F591D|nr:YchJ family protein [Chryseobacterium sp.]